MMRGLFSKSGVDAAVAAALLSGIALAGCRSSYKEALAARQDIRGGTGDYAFQRASAMARDSSDSALGKLELARIDMLRGDFAASSAVLGPHLEEYFVESTEGPILKTGKIAGNIMASTIRDDRAIPYETPGFEMLFALCYQAFNLYQTGDSGNAGVYLRRATTAQEQMKEKYESEHPEKAEKSENAANAAKASSQIEARLASVASGARASYENALAWYLAGLVFSIDADDGNAELAFGQAAAICPALAGFAAAPPGEGVDVTVVYEESLVDLQEPMKIPLPFGGTLWSVDFPVYGAPARPPSRIAVEAGGGLAAECVPAVNVQALAYRTLRDRIPAIAARNVARAAVKIAAQQVANHINTGNTYTDLALQLGVLAFNVFGTATDEADTRCWQTLPEHVHIARVRCPPGAASLTVRNAGTGKSCTVEIPSGAPGPVLAWISDIHAYATVGVAPLARGKATWKKTASLLNP